MKNVNNIGQKPICYQYIVFWSKYHSYTKKKTVIVITFFEILQTEVTRYFDR